MTHLRLLRNSVCAHFRLPWGLAIQIAVSVFSTVALVKLWHVVNGIYMSVALSCRAVRLLNRDSPLLAGNLSPRFTMSGMSSKGVAPTDGQYGSVAFSSPSFIID